MLLRQMVAEMVATGFLLISILAPGIFVKRLTPADDSMLLMAVAAAVFATLLILIQVFGPVSGAHLNPLVTLAAWRRGDVKAGQAFVYIAGQVIGAVGGVVVTHAMFEQSWWQVSTTVRTGTGQWLGEVVATFGLFCVLEAARRFQLSSGPLLVASYVFAAIWFTSSTCFANPAVTIARSLTATPTGISPENVAAFIGAEAIGATLGILLFAFLDQPATSSKS